MARYECNRCHADLNTTDFDVRGQDHICKDLKKRYERQAKAVEHIYAVCSKHNIPITEEVALEIIRKLSGLDLETT